MAYVGQYLVTQMRWSTGFVVMAAINGSTGIV